MCCLINLLPTTSLDIKLTSHIAIVAQHGHHFGGAHQQVPLSATLAVCILKLAMRLDRRISYDLHQHQLFPRTWSTIHTYGVCPLHRMPFKYPSIPQQGLRMYLLIKRRLDHVLAVEGVMAPEALMVAMDVLPTTIAWRKPRI